MHYESDHFHSSLIFSLLTSPSISFTLFPEPYTTGVSPMKKKYSRFQDAILCRAKDFQLVQETQIADDGSVKVIGWGKDETEFPPLSKYL